MTNHIAPTLERHQVLTLRLEGLAFAALGLAIFALIGASWWLFAVLILAPDLVMLGYLVSPRIGSTAYNIVHSYTVAVLLLGLGWLASLPLALTLGAILMVHIGADRLLGYGLKNSGDFKRTHLSLG